MLHTDAHKRKCRMTCVPACVCSPESHPRSMRMLLCAAQLHPRVHLGCSADACRRRTHPCSCLLAFGAGARVRMRPEHRASAHICFYGPQIPEMFVRWCCAVCGRMAQVRLQQAELMARALEAGGGQEGGGGSLKRGPRADRLVGEPVAASKRPRRSDQGSLPNVHRCDCVCVCVCVCACLHLLAPSTVHA